MKCTAAPFLGSDISDGFSEIPAVAVKVLSVVLALSIGLLLRFSQDDGTVPSRALAVTLRSCNKTRSVARCVIAMALFHRGEPYTADLGVGTHLHAGQPPA